MEVRHLMLYLIQIRVLYFGRLTKTTPIGYCAWQGPHSYLQAMLRVNPKLKIKKHLTWYWTDTSKNKTAWHCLIVYQITSLSVFLVDFAALQAETVEATLRKKRRFTLLSSLTRYNIKVKNADEATKQTCLMDLLSCLCGNAEYRDARLRQSRTSGKPFNSVSRIDVVSRVIFPLSFLIANGLFWFAYKIAWRRIYHDW